MKLLTLLFSTLLLGGAARTQAQTPVQAPPPNASREVHIALLSDTHTTRGTAEDQALYKGRFDRVITAVNAAKPDLVLIAGDLTQSGKPEEIADFRLQSSALSAPMHWVAGNHDVGQKKLEGKTGGVTAQRVARFEADLGPAFWLDVRQNVRIIGISSSLLGSDLPREADQWAFLETVLDKPSATPTLLLIHHPPFLTSPDEPGGEYWNVEPAPRARLLALLKRGGVRAVLSGHVHRPILNRNDGILYLTTPPVSFGLPRGVQSQGWTMVTVTPTGEPRSEWHPVAD